MPEEINRVLTDGISDLLFCPEQSGVENLLNEGVRKEEIHLVGHVMIHALQRSLEEARKSAFLDELKGQVRIDGEGYAVLTMHRPWNVDDPLVFSRILDALGLIQEGLPILFPIHPRRRKNLSNLGLQQGVERLHALHLLEPLS
jgi:UDP-N-acetylglucosamine 2-epimerase (non-hydrolysing)